jgi:Bacterial Ig-like domain (group 3)/Calx-beta domain
MPVTPRRLVDKLFLAAVLCGLACVAIAGPWISRAFLAPTQSSGSSSRTSTALSAPPGIRQISLATKDIVYDPVGQRIYASIPSSAANGNSLTQIDPFAGTIGTSVFIGSEPGRLAISTNSQYIYASLDGAAAVRRFDVTSQTAGLQFALGSDSFFGPLYVGDLEVLPGQPDSIAVSRRYQNVSPSHAGVAIYDNGVPRSVTTPTHTGSTFIEFSSSASTLYGYNAETTDFGLRKMTVSSSGVNVVSTNSNLISGFGVDIRFAGGLIYSTTGRVINPETATQVGSFAGIGFGSLVVPDPTANRVYFLTGSGSSTLTLKAFDSTTFLQTGSLSIPGVSGSPGSFIKWANDGLAFRTSGNQIFLLSTSDIVPVTATATPTPAQLANGVTRLSLPTNDLVYDQGTQKVYASIPSSAGTFGNSLTPIDPQTGQMGTPVFIGSEPRKLALSDNGQYIYTGLEGAASIRRFDVASQSPGLQFAVGISQFNGPMYAEDMAVLPGIPNSVAVSRRNVGFSPRHEGVGVYDDGVVRSVTTPSHTGSNVIEFSSSAATLYGYNNETTEFGFRKMTVSASGLSVASTASSVISGFGVDIRYDNGRIYTTSGRVLDPESGSLLGLFNGASGLVVPDATAGRIYYLTGLGSSTLTLKVYDPNTFTQTGTLDITGVTGTPVSFIKSGANLLAFGTGSEVNFVPISAISPILPTPFPSPAQVASGIIQLPLAANDLVYDPNTQKVYASIPSSAGSFGNSLAPIDPVTGVMTTPIFLGSEPRKLAISSNNQFIYAGLDGIGAVRRFDLTSQTAGLQFSLGNGAFTGPRYVDDMAVLPGNPNAVAIARRNGGFSPRHEGVGVYDDGVVRSVTTPVHTGSNVIEFSSSAATLYGLNNETSEFGFRKMLVSASGVSVISTLTTAISGSGDIKYDNGNIYASNGRAINPETGSTLGTFSVVNSLAFVPDASVGRIYFVTGSGSSTALQVFDQKTFLPVGSLNIPNVNGNPLRLIRWGTNGLAFNTSGNQVYFIQDSSLVPPASVNPSSTNVTSSANPINFGQTVTFTATVSSASGTPTGTVQFQDNGVNIGSPQPLTGGVATLSTSALTAGAHVIAAIYSGDANYLVSGGTLAGGQAVLPALSINDASITEGNFGTKTLTFTVTLSPASNQTVTVNYASTNGTATLADNDYQLASGTLSFNPGTLTKTFTVTLNGDQKFEPDETFLIDLTSPVNATISDSQGVGTILNDDTLQLLLDESGPDANQAAALDSLLFLRDPFPVRSIAEWLDLGSDRNTRVLVFVRNLQPSQGQPTAVILIDSSSKSYEVIVEDVRPLPNSDISQVRFRLPESLSAGPCMLSVNKANGQISNSGVISIAP